MSTVFQAIIDEAHTAGAAAVAACTPIPMAVQSGGLTDSFDPSKPYEIVEDGVCGFAWVAVSPANSKFANFLKKAKIGRYSSYDRAVLISPLQGYNFTQSMQKKEAYCHAFAEVIERYDLPRVNVYTKSRMD